MFPGETDQRLSVRDPRVATPTTSAAIQTMFPGETDQRLMSADPRSVQPWSEGLNASAHRHGVQDNVTGRRNSRKELRVLEHARRVAGVARGLRRGRAAALELEHRTEHRRKRQEGLRELHRCNKHAKSTREFAL